LRNRKIPVKSYRLRSGRYEERSDEELQGHRHDTYSNTLGISNR